MNKIELLKELLDQYPYHNVPDFPTYPITIVEREYIRTLRHDILQLNEKIKQKRTQIKNMCYSLSYDTLIKWVATHKEKQRKKKHNPTSYWSCTPLYEYMITSCGCLLSYIKLKRC